MKKPSSKAADPNPAAPPPPPVPTDLTVKKLYRRLDWFTFWLTTLLVFVGYYLTLAPDVTLEDSGELAVGSFYAGVPHPPGYPVWTIYTWLFTHLPISNVAWRVGLSSAVAGALSCGLLALMVSRGSSLMLESIPEFKEIEKRSEGAICIIAGTVAGMLFGFNGFFWSQSVIVEVYSLSVLSFMAVLCSIFRWIYSPTQKRYLYWAFFWFGICFTNHQTLLLAAVGLEVAILAAQPRLGRDLFFWNSVIYVAGFVAKQRGMIQTFKDNEAMFLIFNLVGIGSIITALWTSIVLKTSAAVWKALLRDLLLLAGLGFGALLVLIQSEIILVDHRNRYFGLFVLGTGVAVIGLCAQYVLHKPKTQLKPRWAPPQAILFGAGAYVAYLIMGSLRTKAPLGDHVGAFFGIHFIGFVLLAILIFSAARARDLGSEVKFSWAVGVAWLVGASFYFFMPITSMSNPPMNWGYPRTVGGFFHALTRGQYDQAHPTSEFWPFVGQVTRYAADAIEEFSLVSILIGLIPFLFLLRMPKRERAWIVGLTAIWFSLTIFLLVLLNPGADMQSRNLNRVFFTSSHILIAIGVGYGLSLLGGVLCTEYLQYRFVLLCGGAAALGIEGIYFGMSESHVASVHASSILGLSVAVLFGLAVLLSRKKAALPVFLAAFALMPIRTALSNWSENEQRGHLFGYWFGHDMFTPPFDVFPTMTRDSVLFGGTDPGRFNPTYMIFCESFVPPQNKPLDPQFDRRDVYLITQNALADGTYLDYIRAHYNRSAQKDPYFFSELVRKGQAGTNLVSRALVPLDKYLTDLGAGIEKRRRAEGVYPPAEIHTPSPDELNKAFSDYSMDAQRRYAHDIKNPNEQKQLRPGENSTVLPDGRVSISGQVAVMSINGLLTKVIFDANPGHEFYVEESFPLDWMFPYLTPYGIIMKINRQEMSDLPDEAFSKDRAFWKKYSERLIGDWITDETTTKELADFAEKTYLQRDLSSFKGDPRWVRDSVAQKAFSKLRSAIAGVYCFRLGWDASGLPTPGRYQAKSNEQKQRLLKEAEFALKQSYAFCPSSPEALSKYVNLLVNTGRARDALTLAETSLKFDEENGTFIYYRDVLKKMVPAPTAAAPVPDEVKKLEQQFRQNPSNTGLGLQVAGELIKAKQNESAGGILDMAMNMNSALDVQTLLLFAQKYADIGRTVQLNDVMGKVSSQVGALRAQYLADTNDVNIAFRLISVYLLMQQRNEVLEIIKDLASRTNATGNARYEDTVYTISKVYEKLNMWPEMEGTLDRLFKLMPGYPEAYFDLAVAQASQGKTTEALEALRRSLAFSAQRLQLEPKSKDLRADAKSDARLANIRALPGFEELVK